MQPGAFATGKLRRNRGGSCIATWRKERKESSAEVGEGERKKGIDLENVSKAT